MIGEAIHEDVLRALDWAARVARMRGSQDRWQLRRGLVDSPG